MWLHLILCQERKAHMWHYTTMYMHIKKLFFRTAVRMSAGYILQKFAAFYVSPSLPECTSTHCPVSIMLVRPQFFVVLESFNPSREITVLSSMRDAALALQVFFRSQSFRTYGHGVTLEQRFPFVFFTQHFHYLVTPTD